MLAVKAELEEIAREVAGCTKCSLCKTRNRTVPGEGNPNAHLLFIGEAPGYHEDQQGLPFVGNSGELLDKMFRAIHIPREDVFIANVIKCRPPNNNDPTEEQLAACKPYLDRQIAAINPRVIVTLGRFSMRRFWPTALISRIHGQPLKEDGRIIYPMYHPSAALRYRDTIYPVFKVDAMKIPELLEEAEEIARNELWGQPVETAASAQPLLGQKLQVAEPPVADYTPTIASLTAEVSSETEVESPEVDSVPVPVVDYTQAVVTKAARAPRKPKAATEPGPALEPASPGLMAPRPAPARKKRTPGDGEQLTMF